MAGVIDLVYNPDEEDYDISGELLPCEFCCELFPVDVLTVHQSGCRPDIVHFPVQENYPIPTEKNRAEFNFTDPDFGVMFQKEIENLKEESEVKPFTKSKRHAQPASSTTENNESNNAGSLRNGQNNHLSKLNAMKNNSIILQAKLNTVKNDQIKFLEKADSLENDPVIHYNNSDAEIVCTNINDLSDDESDETMESFLHQAAAVLRQRLASFNKGHKLKQDVFLV